MDSNRIAFRKDILKNISKLNLTIGSEKKLELVETTAWGEFLNTVGFYHQKLDNFVKSNYSLLQLHCKKDSCINDATLPYNLSIFIISGVIYFSGVNYNENSIINIKADDNISFTALEESNLILKLIPELEDHILN